MSVIDKCQKEKNKVGVMHQLINTALQSFFPEYNDLIVEGELHIGSWNKDLHYKISVNNKYYSIRFIGNNRSFNNVFGEITDEILTEQIRYTDYLNQQGIPFMENIISIAGDRFVSVEWKGSIYRVVLFKWVEGKHITACTNSFTKLVGNTVRNIHTVSRNFSSSVFVQESHLTGYTKFISQIKHKRDTTKLSPDIARILNSYLHIAENHIITSKPELDFIVQSDLNPLNMLWDNKNELAGIVDFESIGYTDRIEGLAWLIKWYSRIDGIGSTQMSPDLAKTLFDSYMFEKAFSFKEKDRLHSLLWLSGCMNWNFVKKTIEIIDLQDETTLKQHISFYIKRGEKLKSLLSQM